jgi:hypothetical protein
LNNKTAENIRIARYIERSIPRAGDSIPNESFTQFNLRSKLVQTGISTRILSISDNFGNSI